MGKNVEKKWETASGLPVEALYSAPPPVAPAKPGDYPYTRGIHETMYRGRLWTMRQYAGFGSAEEANRRYRYLLQQGTTGLSVAFDLPTQMGRDSDHRLALGEVGKVGVAISSLDDMRTLLRDIPLDKVSISMTINATAAILLGMLLVVAEERGLAWNVLNGTIQNDVLKEYIARGTYIFPPRPALKIITDIFEFCTNQVPQWNTISISGYHIREAGSTAVEELAFTFANAIAYVQAAIDRGLIVDDFAPRLAFFFNCHNDFLEEIAKFRAARRIWAKLMRERFKAKNSKSWMLRFHTQTAGSSLTAQQPLNNIVRTTIQAMAAVLGGTQSLHTNSYDEALGLPTEESATVALRTQQIIAHESQIPAAVDPFGGSYLIEAWTDRLEQEVAARLEKIDSMGGMLRAIEVGYPQQEIENSAYRYQQRVESKEQIVVGVNEFVSKAENPTTLLSIDPEIERSQVARLVTYRASRDGKTRDMALSSLEAIARGGGNVMPGIIAALRAKATLGEISDTLRGCFGEYQGS
ncbi:MAG: methylmalonyl-CoA mutase [Oligoflexia bacterium]|nr:methylmalonyl-CoA mutase [Oligoflexia bacterium]